jgi:hypothetical protein
MVQPVFLHLEVDGTRHDVARRQFTARIVVLHETRAIGQRQVPALTPQRFGDEKAALLRVIQAGRVELDELHVADTATGAPGHGNAVAGGGVGVAGVAVDLAHAAGGQHHGGSGQGLHPAMVHVQGIHPVAARWFLAFEMARGDHVHRHPALAQRDVGVCLGARQQRVVDGLAGGVGRVRDAAHRVPAFTREVQAQRAVGVARKRHAGIHQPLHGACTVLGDVTRGVFVDDAGTRVLGVAHVRLDAVVTAQHTHDATLGPGGGAFGELALGKHHHRHLARQFQGHGQASQARPDHHHWRVRSRGAGTLCHGWPCRGRTSAEIGTLWRHCIDSKDAPHQGWMQRPGAAPMIPSPPQESSEHDTRP